MHLVWSRPNQIKTGQENRPDFIRGTAPVKFIRQLGYPVRNGDMLCLKDVVGGTSPIVDYSDSGSSTEDEGEGMIGVLEKGKVALVEQDIQNVKDRQQDYTVDLSGTQTMRDILCGGTEVDMSSLCLEDIVEVNVEEQHEGGRVYVVKEEQDGCVVSTYIGDEEYWRNG